MAGGLRIQGHFQLHRGLDVSLNNTSPRLKNKTSVSRNTNHYTCKRACRRKCQLNPSGGRDCWLPRLVFTLRGKLTRPPDDHTSLPLSGVLRHTVCSLTDMTPTSLHPVGPLPGS